ncbi:MAG: protein disulfide oxidoreductase [Gammaproteobacteria bacterium]|nr:protein disulfide oxidoreductase [Gammaproteobacteria bacterium]
MFRLKRLFDKYKNYFSGWRKLLIEVLIIVLVFMGVRHYQSRDMSSGPAQPLHGTLLDNSKIDWAAYKGKPLLIHFWATWCPVCRLEENSIESISQDYNVISIAAWSEDTSAYMQKQGLSFPTLDDIDGVWADRYGVTGVPASFIISKEGNIEFAERGYSSETGLRLRLWWIEL